MADLGNTSDSALVVGGVVSEYTTQLWPYYGDLIRQALDHGHGDLSWQDVMKKLSEGRMQLWLASEPEDGDMNVLAAMVTEVKVYPQQKVANIVLLAGDGFDRWVDYLSVVEAWAIAQGCAELRMEGRRGWERVLPRLGFEHRFTVMGKKLGRLQ